MSKTPVYGEHSSKTPSQSKRVKAAQDTKSVKSAATAPSAQNEEPAQDSKKPSKSKRAGGILDKLGLRHRTTRMNALVAIVGTLLFCGVYLGVAYVIALAFPPQVNTELSAGSALEEQLLSPKIEEPFYVLLIGSDSRKGSALYTGKATEPSQVDQYSDVMTLLRIDPLTYTLTLLTIPQDTRLLGSSETLNASLTGGNPEQVVEAVEALTGTTIKYYMMTNFTAFEGLVDALGGVMVMVPVEIQGVDPLTADTVVIPAGERKLTGAQAIVFARAWEEFGENPDALRQENVRALEAALIETALESPDPTALVTALGDLWRYTDSNLNAALVSQIGLDFFEHRDEVVIYAGTGPWEPDEEDEEVGIAANPKIWADLMAAVDAGEDPVAVVALP